MNTTKNDTETTALFLPWRNEFGTLMMHHVRRIHGHTAKSKIVCCRKGEEVLFPSANEFYYDWEEVPDVARGRQLTQSSANHRYLVRLASRLERQFPHATPHLPDLCRPTRESDFTPKPRWIRGLKTDIVIGARLRQHVPERNFHHWQAVVDGLIAEGLSVSVVGREEVTVPISGLQIRSWDYDDLDAAIELLQNCRLFLGTDSGVTHMAVLAGVPILVFHSQNRIRFRNWGLHYVPTVQKNAYEILLGCWNDPEAIVRRTVDLCAASASQQTRNLASSD
jgi:hypothetical protein